MSSVINSKLGYMAAQCSFLYYSTCFYPCLHFRFLYSSCAEVVSSVYTYCSSVWNPFPFLCLVNSYSSFKIQLKCHLLRDGLAKMSLLLLPLGFFHTSPNYKCIYRYSSWLRTIFFPVRPVSSYVLMLILEVPALAFSPIPHLHVRKYVRHMWTFC